MNMAWRSGLQSPMRSRDAAPIQTPPVVEPWCRDILSLSTECQLIVHDFSQNLKDVVQQQQVTTSVTERLLVHNILQQLLLLKWFFP